MSKPSNPERRHRVLVRRVQRAFLRYLMQHSTGTTDAIRDLLAIPDSAGTAYWGAAVLGLSLSRIIRRVDFVVSGRRQRHGCRIGEWALAVDHDAARHWLTTHAELRDEGEPGEEDGAAVQAAPKPPTPAPLAPASTNQPSLF